VAGEHRDVVCAVHLGLMQGALAELRAPFTAARLKPFVGPSLCVATMQNASASALPEDH
jgi:predicted ArsR family transcriptional regulator